MAGLSTHRLARRRDGRTGHGWWPATPGLREAPRGRRRSQWRIRRGRPRAPFCGREWRRARPRTPDPGAGARQARTRVPLSVPRSRSWTRAPRRSRVWLQAIRLRSGIRWQFGGTYKGSRVPPLPVPNALRWTPLSRFRRRAGGRQRRFLGPGGPVGHRLTGVVTPHHAKAARTRAGLELNASCQPPRPCWPFALGLSAAATGYRRR